MFSKFWSKIKKSLAALKARLTRPTPRRASAEKATKTKRATPRISREAVVTAVSVLAVGYLVLNPWSLFVMVYWAAAAYGLLLLFGMVRATVAGVLA